jgi:hypothetical protein
MKTILPAVLSLLILGAAGSASSADRGSKADGDDEPTLLERLMIRPRRDEFSDADRRRAAIERSLPGMTAAPPPESGWDEFLEALANADINKAGAGQRVMIEKLNDPDFNRLPH